MVLTHLPVLQMGKSRDCAAILLKTLLTLYSAGAGVLYSSGSRASLTSSLSWIPYIPTFPVQKSGSAAPGPRPFILHRHKHKHTPALPPLFSGCLGTFTLHVWL